MSRWDECVYVDILKHLLLLLEVNMAVRVILHFVLVLILHMQQISNAYIYKKKKNRNSKDNLYTCLNEEVS